MAVLAATPEAANRKAWIDAMKKVLAEGAKHGGVKLVDVVHGDDQAEVSDDRALALVGSYPHLEVIMAPTTVGIRAAAKAMRTKTCAAWSAWRWSISRIG